VLAGLVLNKNIIKQILRRDIMRESVTLGETAMGAGVIFGDIAKLS
jgi:hypothetical protein